MPISARSVSKVRPDPPHVGQAASRTDSSRPSLFGGAPGSAPVRSSGSSAIGAVGGGGGGSGSTGRTTSASVHLGRGAAIRSVRGRSSEAMNSWGVRKTRSLSAADSEGTAFGRIGTEGDGAGAEGRDRRSKLGDGPRGRGEEEAARRGSTAQAGRTERATASTRAEPAAIRCGRGPAPPRRRRPGPATARGRATRPEAHRGSVDTTIARRRASSTRRPPAPRGPRGARLLGPWPVVDVRPGSGPRVRPPWRRPRRRPPGGARRRGAGGLYADPPKKPRGTGDLDRHALRPARPANPLKAVRP